MIPKVTVQILGWNHASDLRQRVPRLRAYPREHVLLRYVDNNSQDDSIAVMRAALPEVDIVALHQNWGFAGGHNRGLHRCDTPFVLLLNPDTEPRWEGILDLVQRIEKDSRVGAAQGLLWRDRQRGIVDSTGIVLTRSYNGKERGAGEAAERYQMAGPILAPTGACALFRMSALKAASPDGAYFDEDFFAYKEDVDLGCRLQEQGWQVWYFPIDVGQHTRALRREGLLGWSLAPARIWSRLREKRTSYSLRNWLWLVTKHITFKSIFQRGPFIMGRLVLWALLTLLYWPLGRAWLEAARGIPRMIDKRSTHQAL